MYRGLQKGAGVIYIAVASQSNLSRPWNRCVCTAIISLSAESADQQDANIIVRATCFACGLEASCSDIQSQSTFISCARRDDWRRKAGVGDLSDDRFRPKHDRQDGAGARIHLLPSTLPFFVDLLS